MQYSEKTNAFLLFLSFILFYTNVHSQWRATTGPYSGNISCILSYNSDLYIGTSKGGIYHSTNNGLTWTPKNSGLTHMNITCLVKSGPNLFVGTAGDGVFISTDNGENWIPVNNEYFRAVLCLAVSGDMLFAGSGGVYLSTNNGTTWEEKSVGLLDRSVWSIVISGSNLFAGTMKGIYRSQNTGDSWTTTSQDTLSVGRLAINGQNLYASTYLGLFHSINNGENWRDINTGLTSRTIWALEPSDSYFFAGAHNGVFLSKNNGTTWSDVSTGLTDKFIYSLCVSGSNLFAGTSNNGVWIRPLSEMVTISNVPPGNILTHYKLLQNYPNPFNSKTIIRFEIPHTEFVSLKIYDIKGREIITLVDEFLSAGIHEKRLQANGLTSGAYFYRLQAGKFKAVKKFVLLN